jgi:alkylated DNA repair dioxygenase AlkB
VLDGGQLVVMAGATQRHWEHALPKTKQVRTPRINLTFRTIVGAP